MYLPASAQRKFCTISWFILSSIWVRASPNDLIQLETTGSEREIEPVMRRGLREIQKGLRGETRRTGSYESRYCVVFSLWADVLHNNKTVRTEPKVTQSKLLNHQCWKLRWQDVLSTESGYYNKTRKPIIGVIKCFLIRVKIKTVVDCFQLAIWPKTSPNVPWGFYP